MLNSGLGIKMSLAHILVVGTPMVTSFGCFLVKEMDSAPLAISDTDRKVFSSYCETVRARESIVFLHCASISNNGIPIFCQFKKQGWIVEIVGRSESG